MLVIRAIQIKAFEDERSRLFHGRLAGHLARKYGLDLDHALGALVGRGIGMAERYGIVTEQGAAMFLEWIVEEGESFAIDPARPLARQILLDAALPEPVKLDMLVRTRPWATPAVACLLEDDA
jgi:hypothetical protein